MPERVWKHDCLVVGGPRYEPDAICLDCGDRAEFSHWSATFGELRRRIMDLGGGRAPAEIHVDQCPGCCGHGYAGDVFGWRDCEVCGGRGLLNGDPVRSVEGAIHHRAKPPGPKASAARRKLWMHDPNMFLVPMVGAVPWCLLDWPPDPRTDETDLTGGHDG